MGAATPGVGGNAGVGIIAYPTPAEGCLLTGM
jgi:hypothetical protein